MSDHHHYDYADARHDHRGDYADQRHDHDNEYAEKHHRHYDDERTIGELQREVRELAAALAVYASDLSAALGRIRQLEQQAPQGRQLQLEADQAAADLAESGHDRHGLDCPCPFCIVEDDAAPGEPPFTAVPRLRWLTCTRTVTIDGNPEACGLPVDHEPDETCPGNPHARPAPEASQS